MFLELNQVTHFFEIPTESTNLLLLNAIYQFKLASLFDNTHPSNPASLPTHPPKIKSINKSLHVFLLYPSKSFPQQLSDRNSPIDIIALSETFLTDKVSKLVDIPGYTLHSIGRKQSKGGDVCLLLKHGIRCKWRKDLEEFIEKESEHIFIEITSKCGRKIVVGSSYRAPTLIQINSEIT